MGKEKKKSNNDRPPLLSYLPKECVVMIKIQEYRGGKKNVCYWRERKKKRKDEEKNDKTHMKENERLTSAHETLKKRPISKKKKKNASKESF